MNKDPYIYRVKQVLRVVDGDTIDVDIDLGFDISLTKRVRLSGVDTPESRTTDLKEKALGLEVKEWLKKNLDGKKNIPFWRDEKSSIDFARIFTEPRSFDLVSWVQGTAATPYLEKGTTTDARVWNEMLNAFGSNLFGFVVWFN